jgi:outer membrane protein OmpA-like peptidoglycan-associated protein
MKYKPYFWLDFSNTPDMRALILFVIIIFSGSAMAQEYYPSDAWDLNSPADEQIPVLSADGKTIFFTRGHHPQNTGGKADKGDVWVSHFSDSAGWALPVKLPAPINNQFYNGVFDAGSKLFLYGIYRNGSAPIPGISSSTSLGGQSKWQMPQSSGIKYFQNKSANNGNSISRDGSILILSIESFKTLGAEDLYVSFWQSAENEWSEPKNLGAGINTKLQELTPFLAPDNKTLFFSTNGRGGVGSRDIFVSQRLDDSWTKWSEPRNLGEGINTEGAEMGYRYYPELELAVYTSTKDSDGYGDIHITPVAPEDINQLINEEIFVPMDVAEIEEKQNDFPIEEGENTLVIRGGITDLNTSQPVFARIKVLGADGFEQEHFNDTTYSFTLLAERDYVVQIEADGYFSKQIKLLIKTNKAKEIVENIEIERIVTGARIELKNVLFRRGEAEFLASSYDELNLVAEMMINNPTLVIELAGHTDGVGNPNLNKRLSQERVDAVINYLIEKNIDSSRLSGTGYGGTVPIASNATETTRKLNRRVEFIVVKQ